ncbi:YraN family protein [Sodalis endosymbiont of Spalangia cameroni]|uniref:YraN family protein n=1 Tax=Sodalis praecaptivus TaxID=1239307 RepID=UPI0031F84EE5
MAEIPARPTHSGAVSGRSRGAQAERFARRRLEQAGLRFVAANMQVRGGEIDLIMREGITWVFVEVRYRRSDTFGTAAESVTARKRRRLLRAAQVWLAQRGASFDTSACRFDIIAITGSRVEWLKDAFGAP